jgi:hypothetical protein
MMRVSDAQTTQTRNVRAMFRALKRDIRSVIDEDVYVTRAKLDDVTTQLDVVINKLDGMKRHVISISTMLFLVALMIYLLSGMIRKM